MNTPATSTPGRRFFLVQVRGTRRSVIVFPPDADAEGSVSHATAHTGTRHYPDSGPSIMIAFWTLNEMKELGAPEITEAEARGVLGDKFPDPGT